MTVRTKAGGISFLTTCVLVSGMGACSGSQAEIKSFGKENSACATTQPEEKQAFSVSQAQRSLIEAELAASNCSQAAAKTSGRVLMTWGNAGCVLNLRLDLEDTGLTPGDLDCIANAFFAARMDPFSGDLVSVSKAMLAP